MTMVLNGTSGVTTNSGTLISATTIGVGGTTPAASGAGVSFPATQSASSDVNTLDDYEEGTWTPTDASGASLSFSGNTGYYTKIGNLVYARLSVTYPSTGNGSQAVISMPFTAASGNNGGAFVSYSTATINPLWAYVNNATAGAYLNTSAGAAIINSTMSAKRIDLSVVYAAA
jgi:hypothetical protein